MPGDASGAPAFIAPMLAASARRLPPGAGQSTAEVKWDGLRLAPIRYTPTQSTATYKPSSQPQESPRTTQPVITLNSGDWTDHMG
jgi:hypothetical protein